MADETTTRTQDRSNAGAANIPNRLNTVLDALANGIDPATLPPAITRGFNLTVLRSLPRSLRHELVSKEIGDDIGGSATFPGVQSILGRYLAYTTSENSCGAHIRLKSV